jgi:hypothetical protein
MEVSELVAAIVAGVLIGVVSVGWKLRLNYRLRQQKKDILRGMLTDGRWEWRTIESLSLVIREDQAKTRELLIEIRAHASTDKKEVWTLTK